MRAAKNLTFILAGGGTGGHLFPALAIAEELKKQEPEAQMLFVGTKGKIETRVVPERGYPLTILWLSGFRRSLSPGNLLVPLKIVVSIVQSFFLVRRANPSAVIGTGGYVCGPVLFVASLLGIPTAIHESNSFPGITTRLLAGRVSRVFAAFEDVKQWIPNARTIEIVGTPTLGTLGSVTREEALRFFRLNTEKKTLLIVGGSLGATSINAAILPLLEALDASGTQCIWQTGTLEFEPIRRQSEGRLRGWVGAFIERMDLAYAAADLVLCRAGATTIAELTRVGKAAIVVPYPHSAEDHQTRNAKTLVDAGAALMITDKQLPALLKKELFGLLQNQAHQTAMAAASKKLGRPDAARRVAEAVLHDVGIRQ